MLSSDDYMTDYLFDGSESTALQYRSSLINGKGRHGNNSAPLSIFTVKQGQKHRFHVIFASLEYYHSFSIDQHKLTVIESDGHPVKPVTVDSLIGYMGERYVVEITANQSVGQYWIRGTVMKTGKSRHPVPDGREDEVLAVLRYKEGTHYGEPKTSSSDCTRDDPCKVLNCAWTNYNKAWYPNRVCIPLNDLRHDTSVEVNQENLNGSDVREIFLNLDFPIGSSINHHRHVFPRGALFQEPSTWGITPCTRDCTEKGCLCTHVINLPANRIIQLVMTSNRRAIGNEDVVLPMHHPIHLHGYSFQVVKIGFAIANNQTGRIEQPNPDIVCQNDICSQQHWSPGQPEGLNFKDPPVKDTVIVPAWGYTVVRFRTDNPGYWLLHCHQLLHHMEGMALIFNVSSGIPPAPKDFPTCQDFSMNKEEFDFMLEYNQQCAIRGGCGQQVSRAKANAGLPILILVMLCISGIGMMMLAISITIALFVTLIC